MSDSEVPGGAVAQRAPFFHRVIAAGNLRYWIIGSWALALFTTVDWLHVLEWFAVTTLAGCARTYVESRPLFADPDRQARLKFVVATASCIAWAWAPWLSYAGGHAYGPLMAVVLLMAGYTLVFTQMRAAPREALVVSAPYSAVLLVMLADQWGEAGFWPLAAMAPVLGLALIIKVVITQIKDGQLAAVNDRQAALIDELQTARDRASAASEAKSNFLGVVSHELRTPMNGVLGAAQLLELSDLRPSQRQYVSIIQESGESLLMLLNDVLDLTKIEAGHMALDLAPVHAESLAQRLVGPFEAQAHAKGLDFAFTATGDLPAEMRLDPLRLAQIAHNLLGNAVKFTDRGAVTLTLAGERVDDDRVHLTLSVADTGAGIASGDPDQLFQPFTQVDASSTRRFGGTGLGLSICRRLARLMGGDIAVASIPGEGSTFAFSFEAEVLAWDDATPGVAERPEEAVAGGPLRVLVVEDHPVNRLVLESWLRTVGHDCVLAEDGGQALAVTAVEAFDLIVMDVNMPVMDGLAATRELRQRAGPNQHTPVAVLSASARPEDHAQGYAAGADAYIDKPVDFEALARVMAAALGGRDAVQTLTGARAAA